MQCLNYFLYLYIDHDKIPKIKKAENKTKKTKIDNLKTIDINYYLDTIIINLYSKIK
jgi:hypothetical protein